MLPRPKYWFAWRPVRLTNGKWAWLRYVKTWKPGFALWFEGSIYLEVEKP